MKISTVNFLIALKNACVSNKSFVFVKVSVQVLELLRCLYAESLILSFFYLKKINKVKVFLKSGLDFQFFTKLKIMASSSYGSYIKYLDLCKLLSYYQILIVSTNKGLLTGESCQKYKIGGRLLFIS